MTAATLALGLCLTLGSAARAPVGDVAGHATGNAAGSNAPATKPAAARAQPVKTKARLAVLDIQNLVGVSAELAHGLTAALVVAVRKAAPEASVISTEEIQAMLAAERQKQQLGCSDAGCLAEIGGALGAARMLSGQLAKFGNTYLLTVKLIDVRRATVEQEAAESIKGQEDDALLGAVKRITRKLFPNKEVGGEDLDVTASDLWGSAPAARGGDHLLCWTLGAVAVAGAVLTVVSFLQVKSYNDNAASWNQSLDRRQGGAVPVGLTGGSASDQHSSALTWQAVGFAALGVAVASAGGAALAW